MIAIPAPAMAATCNSSYVSINHTYATGGVDENSNSNFVWRYCTGANINDYIEITSVGGNYNLNHTVSCNSLNGFGGLRITWNVPGDNITKTIPCQSDGANGQTFDIANRRWSAPTICSYAPPGECNISVNYSVKHTIVWNGGGDWDWTSSTRTLS